ncbi:MAG: hypothetical protein AUJ12_09610 [Alphaproteobacteria bacterium CG1_02_46_17]|nr:MAG: hypothetical protein AUJ12_09610 [Alphaproteobacteria bacterium CG1_02_46_17]
MTCWTSERRARQSAAIKRWAPWTKSTGPKTHAGKKKSSMNAYKHGMRSRPWLSLRAQLYAQRLYVRWVEHQLDQIRKNRKLEKRIQSNELLKRTRINPVILPDAWGKPCYTDPF